MAAGAHAGMEGHSIAFDGPRTAFGPEALSRFTIILEEVTVDLVGDGVPAETPAEVRTRLAQGLGFAGSWRTDTQIKAAFAEGITQRHLGLADLRA